MTQYPPPLPQATVVDSQKVGWHPAERRGGYSGGYRPATAVFSTITADLWVVMTSEGFVFVSDTRDIIAIHDSFINNFITPSGEN